MNFGLEFIYYTLGSKYVLKTSRQKNTLSTEN